MSDLEVDAITIPATVKNMLTDPIALVADNLKSLLKTVNHEIPYHNCRTLLFHWHH